MQKKIVFTGKGAAGHVIPQHSKIKEIENDWNIFYIGSTRGIEKELIEKINLPY